LIEPESPRQKHKKWKENRNQGIAMTDNQVIRQSTILVADIGGTNSRFAFFSVDEKGKLTLVPQTWINTAASGALRSRL